MSSSHVHELGLPKVDREIIEKKDLIVSNLKTFTAKQNVLSELDEIKPYETDALAAYKNLPLAVVLPENTKEVSEILKYCFKENIKVIPRGAGTGLSGGALPLNDAILLGLGKFNKILDIDFDNKCVVTQPGVTNLSITHAVKHKGYYIQTCFQLPFHQFDLMLLSLHVFVQKYQCYFLLHWYLL